jgi:hypothetical protein
MKRTITIVVLIAWTLAGADTASADAAPGGRQNVILAVSREPRLGEIGHTSWRYLETWQTDLCRMDAPSNTAAAGRLVRVEGWSPKEVLMPSGKWETYLMNNLFSKEDGKPPVFRVKEAGKVLGSSFPAGGWQQPEFDDSPWVQYNFGGAATWPVEGGQDWVMGFSYRSIALMCLRGRFEVSDPARVSDLSLTLAFSGGAVVYLNGREVVRAGLPKGELAPDTPADDYPPEVYVGPDGFLICTGGDAGKMDKATLDTVKERQQKRIRHLSATLPPSLLRKGVNVLAVAIHRAPAPADMFLRNKSGRMLPVLEFLRESCWWNRVAVEDLSLTTSAGDDIVAPSVSRPRKLCISNQPISADVHAFFCGEPNDPVGPVRIVGLKNGAYAGQLVISSPDPIKGLRVGVTELRGSSGTIPALNIQIGYARFEPEYCHFDALETVAPAEVPRIGTRWKIETAVQPVWVTVRIPRNAAAGAYTGRLMVSADGLGKPVEVPLDVKVVGDWVLPDPQQFVTYVGLIQSPDSVAMQYHVPMWSEAHWKLLEQDFELLGQLGNKDLFIPLVSQTYLGNERTMATWVPTAGGATTGATPAGKTAYRIDWTNVERYLDLAVKHWGKIPNVCMIANYGWSAWNMTGTQNHPQTFTVRNPANGELTEVPHPAWGTPEALAFWKPVFEQFRGLLAKRGLERSLTIYETQFCDGSKEGWKDLKTLIPDLKYTGRSHYDYGAPAGGKWYYLALMIGSGVYWDPEEDDPYYGWREPLYVIASGRGGGQYKDVGGYTGTHSSLAHYRVLPEMSLLTGVRSANHKVQHQWVKRGFGQWGGDFWPVIRNPDHPEQEGKILVKRYSNEGSTSMEQTVWAVISPGRDGPVPSRRSQMLREGLQEAEARVFVQNALLDHADKLGPALAARGRDICTGRTQLLRYCSEYHTDPDQQTLDELSCKLYALADEVAKALRK